MEHDEHLGSLPCSSPHGRADPSAYGVAYHLVVRGGAAAIEGDAGVKAQLQAAIAGASDGVEAGDVEILRVCSPSCAAAAPSASAEGRAPPRRGRGGPSASEEGRAPSTVPRVPRRAELLRGGPSSSEGAGRRMAEGRAPPRRC